MTYDTVFPSTEVSYGYGFHYIHVSLLLEQCILLVMKEDVYIVIVYAETWSLRGSSINVILAVQSLIKTPWSGAL